MSTDEEKDPPVPADLEGKMPRKVHSESDAGGGGAGAPPGSGSKPEERKG